MLGVTLRWPTVVQLHANLMGAVATLAIPSACATESPLKVVKVEEARVTFPDASTQPPVPRVDRPYFDADGRLRWDDRVVRGGRSGGCDWRTRLRAPRVDERRCPRAVGPGTEATLVGLDDKGAVTWQRALAFPSGGQALEQWLIGSSPAGLVLSSLEVRSPSTGNTLVPARTHPVGPDSRPVPDHQFQSAALYDPRRRHVLVFDADVTLVSRRGGLNQFDPATGSIELLNGVSGGWLGTYDRVEAMEMRPDGRYLFLAQQRSVRGPGFVSLAIFELEARRIVFEARHGEGHYCSDPQVVVGPAGHVGLAYRDANTGHHVLVHYRMEP
jgi:hypothetical protein